MPFVRTTEAMLQQEAPTASHPACRDDRDNAPRTEVGRADRNMVSEKKKQEYFSRPDWTTQISLRRLMNLGSGARSSGRSGRHVTGGPEIGIVMHIEPGLCWPISVRAPMQLRRYTEVLLAVLPLALATSPRAVAQSEPQITWCLGYSFSADQRIEGCTWALQSGRWSGQDRIQPYFNRGTAYYEKKEYD